MKHLRLLIALLVSILFNAQFAHADDEASALEYKVKAVVLFNFAKYVQWPAATFTTPSQPIQVCIIGKSPFGDTFQSEDAPKEAQNRPLKVVELSSTPTDKEVGACQIMFWTDESQKGALAQKAIADQHAVLTVSDTDNEKALVSFYVDDGKVRFKIRHKAAKALGLEISSQLLKLATLED